MGGRMRVAGRLGAKVLGWTGVAVVLALALVGFLYVTRGTAVQEVRGVGADGTPLSPSDPQFPLGVAMLTGTVLAPGNRVEIALDGDQTFPRLWDDLRSARQSIIIQIYYGSGGAVADSLRRILLERAGAGVSVFLLYDAFGTPDISREDLARYRAAGIRIAPFRPIRLSTLHVAQNRSHVRAVVVDDRVAWTGGFGIADKWLGDGHTDGAWRETNVRFTGPAVRQLEAAFAAAWAEATGVLLTGRASLHVDTAGVAAAGLLHASPTIGTTPAERFLAMSIAGAQRTLYITNAYFAPDRNFVDLLTRAARRGVDVRILAAGPRTDVRLARMAARARYDILLASGVRIYEWMPSTLHAKTFVIDGTWSTIGTMNFDNRSLALNEEVTLMVLDAGLGRQMDSIFVRDLERAREITAAVFAGRPWYERIGEWGANLVTRLL
ncbi:MAG: phospholipase D-like domain-containing protein [Gemmatimonadaceae bacterium]